MGPPENIFGKELDEMFELFETPVNTFYYMDKLLLDKLQESRTKVIFNGLPGDGIVSVRGTNVLALLALQLKFRKLANLARKQSKILKVPFLKIMVGRVFLPMARHLLPFLVYLKNPKKFLEKDIDRVCSELFLNKSILKDQSSIPARLKILEKSQRKAGLRALNSLQYLNTSFYKNFSIEEFSAHQGKYQFEYAFPFADRRLIEFMNNLPEEKLILQGWPRGLIRMAMDGILPPKIQFRLDKVPFSPGYRKIFDDQIPCIHDFFLNLNTNHIIWEIFNRGAVLKMTGEMLSRTDHNKHLSLVFIRIYIVSRFTDYFFNNSSGL